MAKSASEMWDERYANENFVYGIEPNAFFKGELYKLKVGRLLLPAEGEGKCGFCSKSVMASFSLRPE